MRVLKIAIQSLFYLLVLAFFVSQAASAGFSHDENQFIAPGQLLVSHGLLPYVSYPYTHMPYAVVFYALTAAISNYDFLTARLLNALVWFACTLIIVKAFRDDQAKVRSWWDFLWEFAVALIFLSSQILGHIVGNALNHSFATLFGLLALVFFIRTLRSSEPSRSAAFAAGACAAIAAFTRFNFATMVVVLAVLLVIHRIALPLAISWRTVLSFAAGAVVAAIPVLGLIALAPSGFLYANYVYIRLNTIYYQELLYRVNMQLGQKLLDFLLYLIATPIDLLLYLLLLLVWIWSGIRYLKHKEPAGLNTFAIASCTAALAVTAFGPSPTQPQYFLAAIPFLCVVLFTFGLELDRRLRLGLAFLCVALLILLKSTVVLPDPVIAFRDLADPSRWTPVQAHDLALRIRQDVPRGRILSLLPMFTLEAGDDVYPFTASGPFNWRTSLLLTPARRLQYGVTSPEELPGILRRSPPNAILTGFESTNAGFKRDDLGGLESPFVAYANANGFRSVPLAAPFLDQSITLWIAQP